MTIKGDIISYFMDHEGEHVSAKQLMTATGHAYEQVRVGVNNLRNDRDRNGHSFRDNIDIIVSGDVWKYTAGSPVQLELPTEPDAKTVDNRVFEEVGTTVDGSILVKCEDGRFYKLTEL